MQLPVPIRRVGYRAAYRILKVLWFVWRPRVRGVKCLLTADDQLLLVRHTYGRRSWDLPGGAIKRRERPIEAAQREMEEELGLGSETWNEIGQLRGRVDHRQDTIYCFHAELSKPGITPDHGELETVRWFARGDLPADLSPYVRPVLSHAPERRRR